MNSVAGTCSSRSAAMTFSLYQDATFLLRSSPSMPGVMSASNVSATIFLSVAAWSKLSGLSAEAARAVETASVVQSTTLHVQRTDRASFLLTRNATLKAARRAPLAGIYPGMRYCDSAICAMLPQEKIRGERHGNERRSARPLQRVDTQAPRDHRLVRERAGLHQWSTPAIQFSRCMALQPGASGAAPQRYRADRPATAPGFRCHRPCGVRQPRLRGDEETPDRQGRNFPDQPGSEQHALAAVFPRSQ